MKTVTTIIEQENGEKVRVNLKVVKHFTKKVSKAEYEKLIGRLFPWKH